MKKGFTLIELIAVIVVLAVVALVAVPIATNVIDNGKKGAAESSTNFYIKEIETKYSEWIVEGIPDDLPYDTSEYGYIKFNVEDLNNVLKLDGENPISGYIKINDDYTSVNNYFGYVVSAELKFENGYVATYTYYTGELSDHKGSRVEITVEKAK